MFEDTVNLTEDCVDESTQSQGVGQLLREFLFRGYYCIARHAKMKEISGTGLRPKVIMSCIMMLHALQLLSLTFPGPVRTSSLENLFCFARVDYLFLFYDRAKVWYGLTVTLVFFAVGVLLWLGFRASMDRKLCSLYYFYWLSWPLDVSVNLLTLPTLCILMAFIKYSNSPDPYEYSGQGSIAAAFPSQELFTGAVLVLFVGLVYFETSFNYIQDRTSTSHTARPHSHAEHWRLIVLWLMAASHFAVHEISPTAHLLVLMVLNGIQTTIYWHMLPFYSSLMQHLSVFTYWVGCSGAFYQFLGLWLDIPNLVFWFTGFLTPVHCYCLASLITRRKKVIASAYATQVSLSSMYQYELLLRHVLETTSEERLTAAKRIFGEIKREFPKSAMPVLWEFLFVYSVQEDEALANLKLARALEGEFTLETQYKYFHYKQMVAREPKTYQEETDYIHYRLLFDEARRDDLATCQMSLNFWTELLQTRPSALEALGCKLSTQLEEAKTSTDKLLKEYPMNAAAMRWAASFYSDTLNNSLIGRDYMIRANNQQINTNSGKMSYFDEDIGIIIVSGRKRDCGNITSMNQTAARILSVPLFGVTGTNISTFIPPPYNAAWRHNAKMMKFLEHCEDRDVKIPLDLFFLDYNEFLVEAFVKIKAAATESHPFFIAAIKVNPVQRECAYLSEDNVIFANTKEFAVMAGYAETSVTLARVHIETLIPDYRDIENNVFQFRTRSTGETRFACVQLLIVHQSCFKILYLFDNYNEALNLKARGGIAFDEIQHASIPRPAEYSPISPVDSEYRQIDSAEQGRSPEEVQAENPNEDAQPLVGSNTSNLTYERVAFNHKLERELLLILRPFRLLRISMLMFLVMLLISGASITVYTHLFSRDLDAESLVFASRERRLVISGLSERARDFQLADSASSTESSAAALLEDIEWVLELTSDISDAYTSINDQAVMTEFTQKEYPAFELLNDQIIQSYSHIEELVDRTTREAQQVLLSETLSDADSHFFYIYRNTPAETYAALNTSVSVALDYNTRSVVQYKEVVQLLCGTAGLAVVLCLIVVCTFACTIEKKHLVIWRVFSRLNPSLLVDMRIRSEQRITECHGAECLTFKQDSITLASRTHDFHPMPKIYAMLGFLLGFAALNLGALAWVYHIEYTTRGSLLLTYPYVYDLAGQRREALRHAYFWTQEAMLDSAYFQIVPEYQHVVKPSQAALEALEVLEQCETALVFGDYAGVTQSAEHSELLLETVSTDLAAATIGVHTALNQYQAEVLAVFSHASSLESLKKLEHELEEKLQDLDDLYASEFNLQIDELYTRTICVLLNNCLVNIVVYAFLFARYLRRVEHKLRSIWSLTKLLPWGELARALVDS